MIVTIIFLNISFLLYSRFLRALQQLEQSTVKASLLVNYVTLRKCYTKNGWFIVCLVQSSQQKRSFVSLATWSLRGRRKKGRESGEGEKRERGEKGRRPLSSFPNPPLFSLPPYPLPLSTPARQATCLRMIWNWMLNSSLFFDFQT